MVFKILIKILECLPQKAAGYITNSIVNKVISKYAKINVEGYDNLKDVPRPVIFICNHLSNADGLILNKVLANEDVTFVTGVKLSNNSFTKLGVLSVKTTPIVPNSPDKEGLKKVIKILNSGNNIVVFPEGTRSRSGSMIQGKKGVLLMQRLSKASVVPIGLIGTENLLPINDEDMGKEKFQHTVVNVKIGKPIQIIDKEKNEDKEEYEERVLNSLMISIAALLPAKYRGIYAQFIE